MQTRTKQRINSFISRPAMMLGSAVRRVAVMLLMMLMTMSAWATVRTVTYTIEYKDGNGYYLAGDDGSRSAYFKLVGKDVMTLNLTMGNDVTITIESKGDCLKIGTYYPGTQEVTGFARSFDNDIDVTVACQNHYICYFKIIGFGTYYAAEVLTFKESSDNQKSSTLNWRHDKQGTSSNGDAGKFIVSYSDAPAYRLAFELNGGQIAGTLPEWYENATDTEIATPTRTGYDFCGWYDNEDFNGQPITRIAAGSTGNKTLYAKWSLHTSTITYEPNGGSMPANYPTTFTVNTPTFSLPTPTRSGYDFYGWYTNEDFASAKYKQILQGSCGDLTLYAKWVAWTPDGSKLKPYKIATEADLIALRDAVNGGDRKSGIYYQQTADITITEANWTPIGKKNTSFCGNYDGGNFTISGVNINTTSTYQGLFGQVGGTTNQNYGFIQNINLVNSNITGGSYTGAIVGYTSGSVLNCHVGGSVSVHGSSTDKTDIGGVVGSGTIISGCTSMASVSTGKNLGGVIGRLHNSSTGAITDCFSYGTTPYGEKVAGVKVSNVAQVSAITTGSNVALANDIPQDAIVNLNGKDYYKAGAEIPVNITLAESPGNAVFALYSYDGGQGVVTNGSFTMPAGDVTLSTGCCDLTPFGYSASYKADGSVVKPYVISTTEGWEYLRSMMTNYNGYFKDKHYQLGADFTLTTMVGTSDRPFCGTFDGDGKTLTFNHTATEDYCAPFRYVDGNACFRNLRVSGTISTDYKYAAGIVANLHENATLTIQNCHSGVAIESGVNSIAYHGGFVALADNSSTVTISNSVFDGRLSGASTACGGFVGYGKGTKQNSTLENCLFAPAEVFTKTLNNRNFARGPLLTITNCYFTQKLGINDYTQGMAAYVYTPATEDFVPSNVGELIDNGTYDASIVAAYESGLKYNGKFYMVKDTVDLADNADIVDHQVADVTLQGRTLYKDGDWNTLCLPFDVVLSGSALDGADVRALDNANMTSGVLTLNFTNQGSVTTIEAGKPYIIKWSSGENLVNPVFSDVTVKSDLCDFESNDGKVLFKGTYSPISWEAEDQSILFLGTQSKLHWPLSGASLGAFRAYFQLTDPTAGVREFKLNFDGEETTGVVSTTDYTDSTDKASAIYDLQGRKVENPKKGLYIHGGRKVIIK